MIMVLSHAFCNISVAPVHLDPAHRSEQTTQLLFGEKVEILELNDHQWARIRGRWDGYEGWCRIAQLQLILPKEFKKPLRFISYRHHDRLLLDHSELWLPLGSELSVLKSNKFQIGTTAPVFKGKRINLQKVESTSEGIRQAALQYLHAPYQWGGRTIAGIDCSGLVQMAYKLCGQMVPRDASEQAKMGLPIDFLMEARCGDLAFFDNEEGRIVHVGIMLDHETIIHATDTAGRVVVDKIDNGGIISIALKKRTHNLRMVRRLLANT